MKPSALRTLVRAARAWKTKTNLLSLALALVATLFLFTGCASIVDGSHRTVNISSNPPGAKVTIYDRRGRQVSVNTTPTTVILKTGGSFRSASYRLDFEMSGYQSCQTGITPRMNPKYWGNFLFLPFSPIGFLVDPATGAMWRISPTTVSCNLRP